MRELCLKLQKEMDATRRRRVVRIFALFLNPLLLFLIFRLIIWVFYMEFDAQFDPRTALNIEVSQCGVEVYPCSAGDDLVCPHDGDLQLGTVRIHRNVARSKSTKVFRIGTNILEYLTVENENTCYPGGRLCDAVCRIKVFVPAENTFYLAVNQKKTKALGISSFNAYPEVVMDTLLVKGGSLLTEIDRTVIRKKATVSSGSEHITVTNSKLKNGWLSALYSNIRVVYEKGETDVKLVKVDHRSTTYPKSSCFHAAQVQHADTSDIIQSCLLSTKQLTKLRTAFDADLNNRITQADFTAGLGTLNKCCGSSCPILDSCSWAISPLYVPSNVSFISYEGLQENILAVNDYTVIPYCFHNALLTNDPTVNLSDTSSTVSSSEMEQLTLETDQGMIQVLLPENKTEMELPNLPVNNEEFELRMVQGSAQPLMEQVRDIYGNGPVNLESETEDIYAVIYVEYSPYIGSMAQNGGKLTHKFIYTNNPIYLSISPPWLSALSMGLLDPAIKIYRTDFVSFGCWNGNDTAEDIGEEIHRILMPRFRTSLWGTLVQVVQQEQFLLQLPFNRLTKDPASGKILKRPFQPELKGYLCLIISFAIGVILAGMILSKFSMVMQVKLQKKFKTDDARSLVFERNSSLKAAGNMEQVTDSRKDKDRYLMRNVLERPVELCDLLIVDPVRRYYADSFKSFVNQTYFVNPRYALDTRKTSLSKIFEGTSLACCARDNTTSSGAAKVTPAGTCGDMATSGSNRGGKSRFFNMKRMAGSLTMNEFLKEYEKFCFQNNVDMEDDVTILRKRLLEEYGVRTRRLVADRVYGVVWKHKPGSEKHTSTTFHGIDLINFVERIGKKELVQQIETKFQELDGNSQGEVDTERAKLIYLLELFVDTFCTKTGVMTNFVSYEDLVDVNGSILPGFQSAFLAYCGILGLSSNYTDPNAAGILKEDIFQELGIKRAQTRLETIRALEKIDEDEDIQLSESTTTRRRKKHAKRFSYRWYALQYLETVIHQFAFAFGPVMVLLVAMTIQDVYASSVGGEFDLHWEDVLVITNNIETESFNYDISAALEFALYSGVIVILFCYFLLLLVYCDAVSLHPVMQRFIRSSYKIVFSFTLFLLITFTIVQCVWILLAAFLKPEKFLPFGACITCFVTVLSYQFQRIWKAKEKVEEMVSEVFQEMLKSNMIEAVKFTTNSSNQVSEKLRALVETGQYEFDPNDLFNLIDSSGKVATKNLEKSNTANQGVAAILHAGDEGQTTEMALLAEERKKPTGNGDDRLSHEEFDQLFDSLGINVMPTKREMLFAYCDVISPDGYISRDEFLAAWEYLMEELKGDIIAKGFGLSNFQITMYLLLLSLTLFLTFAFLLISIAAFNPNGDFNSIIQSAIIAGATKFSSSTSDTFGAAASAANLSQGSKQDLKKQVSAEVDAKIATHE